MATPDEDFSGLPLQERLVHKSWKARSGAYDELSKIFATLDPDADAEYKKWQDSLKAIVADSNAVAQETGLGAVMSYVTNAPNAKKTRSVLASSIVDKCLGSVRAGTRQKALDVLLMYIEIDVADPIIEEILPSLAHKNPKNVTAAITALREAIRQFGTRVVSVKPIVKQLPKIFDHKDKNVRAEGTALAMELHRWLGAALISTLNDLKPVQLKELTEQFAAASTDKATPERLLRSEQVKATVPQVDEDLNGDPDDAEATEEPDAAEPLDLFDPVNVLDKLPKDFYEQLASAKWKDRKEALEALYEVAKAPKLEDGRYGELVGALGKRINDANLLVVTASANCIAAIAGGLRTTFTQYKSLVVTPVIEKFKEKKQTVVDALRSAVDAVYLAAGINSIAEDIVGGVGHKNPQVRTESLKWATRSLKDTRQVPGKPEIKILSEALAKALDDSDAGVRESAAEAFGTFMKVVTERVLASTTEKIDHLKLSKVKEYFDKAEIRAKAAPPPAAKKVAAKRPASAPAVKPLKPAPPGQPKSNSPPPRKSTTAKAAAPKQRPSAAAAPVRA
ncbi:armadillo-type protein, partial [Fimicolochytrium jonesii]|uniref:armadillo-type protein n=1 Tax=Fimicolochytrium jonesii TaxID=1396493 RepID=UPI0022FDC7C5